MSIFTSCKAGAYTLGLVSTLILCTLSVHAQQQMVVFHVGAVAFWPVDAFTIENHDAEPLTLQRGTTYAFVMDNTVEGSGQVFYITTDSVGGSGDLVGNYTTGVTPTNGVTKNGDTLKFTPGAGTPDTLYYQSDTKPRMGAMLVMEKSSAVPVAPVASTFSLSAASPNPVSAVTRLMLTVAQRQHVRTALYNAVGDEVALLGEGMYNAGQKVTLALNAALLPNGTYIVRSVGDACMAEEKVVVAK